MSLRVYKNEDYMKRSDDEVVFLAGKHKGKRPILKSIVVRHLQFGDPGEMVRIEAVASVRTPIIDNEGMRFHPFGVPSEGAFVFVESLKSPEGVEGIERQQVEQLREFLDTLNVVG